MSKIIIGNSKHDKALSKYILTVENDQNSISTNNCPIEEIKIHTDFLKNISNLLLINRDYLVLNNIDIDIKLIIDVYLKVIGSDEGIKYIIYMDDKKINVQENSIETKNEFEIHLTVNSLYYLLQIAP